MDKKKLIGAILGVIVFLVLIAGVTYATLSWTRNTGIAGGSRCFDITYSGTGFNGSILPSTDYTDGVSSSVTMKIDAECHNITGEGELILHTTSFNVGETSMLSKNALKYAVLLDGTVVGSGTVTETGDLTIYSNFTLATSTQTAKEYTVYLWLDETAVDADLVGVSYSGYLHASANQTGA